MATKAAFLVGIFIFTAVSVKPQTRRLITENVDNSNRVTVQHSRHPLVSVAYDQGRVEGSLEMSRMILVLSAPPEVDSQVHAFLDGQQTVGSPNYHRWLDPEEFGRRFGPSPDDLQIVREWLEKQGFRVESIARSGKWMEFSGTASQVEVAFATEMHYYVLDGASHIANAGDISIPAALAPVVRGVLSLNDFFKGRPPFPLRSLGIQIDRMSAPDVDLENSTGPYHALGPGDFAAIYNLASLYRDNENGSGITIAVVADSNIHTPDIQNFRTIFSLPQNNPNVILNGPDPGFNQEAGEATLDVEWAGAVAPNATIDLVVSTSTATTGGVALSAAYIVDNNLADILSESFQECEQGLGSTGNLLYQNLWQQAAAQGISVFVSAGDGGAAGCQDFRQTSGPAQGSSAILAVNGLGSTPFNTAVGGTDFQDNGGSVYWGRNSGPQFASALGYIPEAVWNSSCDPTLATTCPGNEYSLFAGGGGVSAVYSKPAWQSLSVTGVPNDNQRDLPDVSLTASAYDGYIVCFSGNPSTACSFNTGSDGTVTSFSNVGISGGTSASGPSFAGIMAIVDQKTGGRQGLANYVLYQLAAKENFANCNSSAMTNPAVVSNCIFNDITEGNNSIPGVQGYSATTGYDLASGLGSVNGANLVNAWSLAASSFQGSQTSLSASVNGVPVTSIVLQHGQSVSISVSVKPLAGTGVPSGAVAFITSQYTAAAFNPMASGTLSNGIFQGSLSSLPGGQYNLLAHYPGDGIYASSDSNSIPVSVTPEDSSISLKPVASSHGAVVGVLATVIGASMQGTPTGQVNFADGGIQIASIALNSAGQAQLYACGSGPEGLCLAAGTHTITASYSGDNSLGPSPMAGPLTVPIQATPTISFSTLPGPSTSMTNQVNINAGQSITLQAEVQGAGPILPSGSVQFLDGSAPLGQAVQLQQASSGGALIAGAQLSLLQLGTHTLSAQYSGNGNYASVTSSTTTVTVTQPFQLSTPNSWAYIASGKTATYSLTLQGNSGFSGVVSLACSGLPNNVNCMVTPSKVDLSSSQLSSVVSVSVALASRQGLVLPANLELLLSQRIFPTCLLCLLLIVSLRRSHRLGLTMVMLSLSIFSLAACNKSTTTNTVSFNVTGTSGSVTNSTALTLTITE